MLILDQPVIAGHDTGDWCKEDCVAPHEIKEGSSRAENLPWNDDPATNNSCNDATPEDVDVFGAENGKVICSTDGIGRDVSSDLSDVPGER